MLFAKPVLVMILSICLIFSPSALLCASSGLTEILTNWQNTPEQNAYLWRHLGDLRNRTDVPTQVIEDFNKFRIGTIEQLKVKTVKDLMKSGKYESNALGGFLNTGSWSDPKKSIDPSKFTLTSDIDFTAVGKDPAAVKEFRQNFLDNLADCVGVGRGEAKIAAKLDVNVYTVGGSQSGAYTTPGGRKFFEVYTAGTGGYQQITGRGESLKIAKSNIDNAFIDMGREIPRFTKADVASFHGEMLKELEKALAGSTKGDDLTRKVAKIIERTEYGNAVLQGKVLGQGASQLAKESLAIRRGMPLAEAFAERITKLQTQGYSKSEALALAQKAFVSESSHFVKASSSLSASSAVGELKAAGADLTGFGRNVGWLSKGTKTALGVGMAGVSAYFLWKAYQEGGNKGLLKEIVNLGMVGAFPTTALIQLAGVGVKFVGDQFFDAIKSMKEDWITEALFGKTDDQILNSFQKFHNPKVLKEYIDEELIQRLGYHDDDTINDRIFEKSVTLFNLIAAAQREQKDAQRKELDRVLKEVEKEIAEEKKQQDEEREQEERQEEKIRRADEPMQIPGGGEDRQKGAEKVATPSPNGKTELTSLTVKGTPHLDTPPKTDRTGKKKTLQDGQPDRPIQEGKRLQIDEFSVSPSRVTVSKPVQYIIRFVSPMGGRVTLGLSAVNPGAGPEEIQLETEAGEAYTRKIKGAFDKPGTYQVHLTATDSAGSTKASATVVVEAEKSFVYEGTFKAGSKRRAIHGNLTFRIEKGNLEGTLSGKLEIDPRLFRISKNRLSGALRGRYDEKTGDLQAECHARVEVRVVHADGKVAPDSGEKFGYISEGISRMLLRDSYNELNGRTLPIELTGSIGGGRGAGAFKYTATDMGQPQEYKGTWKVKAIDGGR